MNDKCVVFNLTVRRSVRYNGATVMEKNRVHYEYYHLKMTENVPEDYTEILFVCLREDGCLELPATTVSAR